MFCTACSDDHIPMVWYTNTKHIGLMRTIWEQCSFSEEKLVSFHLTKNGQLNIEAAGSKYPPVVKLRIKLLPELGFASSLLDNLILLGIFHLIG